MDVSFSDPDHNVKKYIYILQMLLWCEGKTIDFGFEYEM